MDPEEVALKNQRSVAYRAWSRREQDAREGMAWWADLQPHQQAEWMRRAGSDIPAKCWEAFKAQRASESRESAHDD